MYYNLERIKRDYIDAFRMEVSYKDLKNNPKAFIEAIKINKLIRKITRLQKKMRKIQF